MSSITGGSSPRVHRLSSAKTPASSAPILEPDGMLEIRNLTVAYGGVVAINDANLDVAAGRMVAIVGANGAGKTTLLNAISGVVKSAGGTIRFDGRQIEGMPGHKVAQMGIIQVPEGRQILAPLTVEENLRLGHL